MARRRVQRRFVVVEREARQGNAAAQCELGSRFFFGFGAPKKDNSEAYSFLVQTQGNVLAIAAIADCYSHGHGVKEDKGELTMAMEEFSSVLV